MTRAFTVLPLYLSDTEKVCSIFRTDFVDFVIYDIFTGIFEVRNAKKEKKN